MEYIVKITAIRQVTHDVKCFQIEKPAGYSFTPGQATDLSINKPGMENETRPFTFTALNSRPYLEFTIKRYPAHKGITEQLHNLSTGDELIIRDAWGAIAYNGPGHFIAGGAGITPFIAILRELHNTGRIKGNTLFFSNKTKADIIYREELTEMLGDQAVFILTRELADGYLSVRIDKTFIKKQIPDFHGQFYVCGPDAMVAEITDSLKGTGAASESLIFEK